MGALIALGVIILLAILPLGVSVRYNAAGALVRVILGPVKLTLLPRPEKPKKEKKPAAQKAEQAPKPQKAAKAMHQPENPAPPPQTAEKKPEEKGGSITDFLPLVRVGLDFLGDFRRKLRLDVLEVKLILAGGDPANLAINYGRAWAAVGNLMPQLDRLFVIKKRDIEVECDFTGTQTAVLARLDLTITLGRLVSLAVGYGIRALKEFLKINKKRKGGADQ